MIKDDLELTWDNTYKWEKIANKGRSPFEPAWKWDCNFKLDFDGSFLFVDGHFYPPIKHYGPGWDGKLRIILFDEIVLVEKSFEADTLEELRIKVEKFVKHYKGVIKSKLT